MYVLTLQITFRYSCVQCLCPCLYFLVVVNIDISSLYDDSLENPLKLVISILFPNKSIPIQNHHIVFIVCIQSGFIRRSLITTAWNLSMHSETAGKETFTWSSSLLHAVVGYTYIRRYNTNLRNCEFYVALPPVYLSWWLPTKARDSSAPNLMLEFSSLKKVANQE